MRGRVPGLVALVLLGGFLPASPLFAQPACPAQAVSIGRIIVERPDVFDTGGARVTGRFARSANALHPQTREQVIRREVLFGEDEPCRSEALAQTERNLRALGIFQRVDVVPVPAADGRLDVIIRARDAWSLQLSGRYQREGAVPTWDLGVSDRNVGGQGFAAGVRRHNGFDADSTTGWLEYPRLAGSRERLSLRVDERSDGRSAALALSRPFYTIDTRWAHEIAFVDTHDLLRVYRDGAVADSFTRRAMDAAAGFSVRLAMPAPAQVWRVGFGYRFASSEYPVLRPPADTGQGLPVPHRWLGPFANLQFVEHRFVKRNGLLMPGRDVDLNLGTEFDVAAFVSQPVAAARTTSAVILGAGVSRGWLTGEDGVLIARARATGSVAGDQASRAEVSALIRGWWRRSPTHVLTAMSEFRGFINPEPGSQVYLGGSPGLRGFREYAFQGTRRALLVLEDRKFAAWTGAGLVRFGGAAFIETGAIGGAGVTAGRHRVLADAGIGIRLAMVRSAGDAVIRVDLACPLTASPEGRRRPQLVIGYRGG